MFEKWTTGHVMGQRKRHTQICVKTRTDLILRETSSKDESQVVDSICVTGEDKEIVKSHSLNRAGGEGIINQPAFVLG